MQLPQGIHVAVRGWLSANQVFLQNDHVLDVVDSGFCNHASQTLQLVRYELNKVTNCQVGKLVNTHLHSDHCGGNFAMQHEMEFEIWIPEASWDSVLHWNEDKLSYKQLGQPCPRFIPNHTLTPNQSIELGGKSWLILAAPGHDHHSIILYQEKSGVLISADALWENGFGSVIHELYDEGGFPEIKDTLDLISELDVSLVIPGHGEPFTNIKQALKNAYSRLDYLASSPRKNALHVCKVLLSYKLMELQKVGLTVCRDWFTQTPVMNQIAQQLKIEATELFDETLNALITAKVIDQENDYLINHG